MPILKPQYKPEAISPSHSKSETIQGLRGPDPFAHPLNQGESLLNAILATALFRCWHIICFFAAWSTLITILNEQGHKLIMQPTLLTAAGTVLGFVVSYRTTASFERYNEGRKFWSQNILASRTMARTIWFHVPNSPPVDVQTADEAKCRALIEKKSVINLLEAFSVAIKHYLRGEDGIYYTDLYHLVKFLPAYNFPPSMPSIEHSLALQDQSVTMSTPKNSPDMQCSLMTPSPVRRLPTVTSPRNGHAIPRQDLPAPVTHGSPGRRATHRSTNSATVEKPHEDDRVERMVLEPEDEKYLMSAYRPPTSGFLDVLLFPALVEFMASRGQKIKGRRAARIRAKMTGQKSHNLPLELSLYISSYIAALQSRKACDVPTINVLLASLNQLVESLTGLERILTSPIPFSYSAHLWAVTIIYCLALPLQIYSTLKWLTIPSTIIVSFIFFGFLVAGEEIEDPFGYDKNDLNLDHFTHNVIRNELRAVTSAPPPDPASWAFSPENNLLFTNSLDGQRQTPEEWMKRGSAAMQNSLGSF